MEKESVLTINIQGVDKVLKSTEQIQMELSNADKILKKMGIPDANIQTIKKFNDALGKTVDMAKLTEKEIDDLADAFKDLQKQQDKIDKGGGNAGSSFMGRSGRFKSLQGIIGNLAMSGGAAGVAVAAVAAGAVAAYEGMSNLTAEIEATNAAALELFDNSAEAEEFAQSARIMSETFGGSTQEIIKQADEMVKEQEKRNKDLKLIGKEEELTHQDALLRIEEKMIANEMAEGKTREEIEATLRMNKTLIDAQDELAAAFTRVTDVNTSGLKLAVVEIGTSMLNVVGDVQDSFSGLDDAFKELTGGFSILDVAVSFTKQLLEAMVKPIQLIGEGLTWLLTKFNEFKNSDWFKSISDGFSSLVDGVRDAVGSVTDLVDTSTEVKMQEAGEQMAKALVERYQEVLGDGLTVATMIEISKVGYMAAQEAFLQGKSIAEAIAAGMRASDAYAQELERKAKELERLRGAEKEYEDAKKKAEDDAIKREKEAKKNAAEKEKREKKEIDKQMDNLNKLKSAYDEAEKKLIEMSKTGSLEDIAKAQEELVKAQTEYNKGLKTAVEVTKDYKTESEKLNEIRAKGTAIDQAERLKNQIADLDKQLANLGNTEKGVMDKLNTLFDELNNTDMSNMSDEAFSNPLLAALDILELVREEGTVTAEQLDELLELTGNTFGVLSEKDLTFIKSLELSKNTIIDKKKELVDELGKIPVTLGGTKDDPQKEVEKNVAQRFEQAGKDIADAFFKGMNSASDEMIKAGTWLGMFQVYKAIEDNQKKITDKGVEMMKTVEDFNTLFAKEYGNILTFDLTENKIKLDQSVIDTTMSKLTGDELEKFKTMLYNVQMTVAFNNREIEAMMINHNTEMQNIMLDFTDVYVKAYQTRNRYIITEQQHLIDELDYHNQDFLEQQLKTIKKEEDERKKSGKRITKNELEVIKMRRDESLRLLKNKHTEELKLEETVGRKAIESAIKQGETQKEVIEFNKELPQEEKDRQIKAIDDATKLIIKQYDLRLVKLKDNQQEESEQQAAQFDKDVQNLKNKKQEEIKAFMDIFNAANELAQILVDIAIQQQQNLVDSLQENISKLDQQIADSQAKMSELEDDLAGKQSGRRDAILRGIELEKQRERELTEQKIKQQRELEKAERKLANQRKAAAITQAVINGALAITNIFATVPKADWGAATFILAGISAATTAAQIALIATQKFAKGGYTGKGDGQRDETGFKVAGVVHQDEWVAPKWMVESPRYGGMINELENVRQKGFADGGFTSKPDFVGMHDSMNNSFIMKQVQRSINAAMMLSERPIVANVTEFDNVSADKYRRMNANRI